MHATHTLHISYPHPGNFTLTLSPSHPSPPAPYHPLTLPQHCSDRAHPQPLMFSPSTLQQHCSEGLTLNLSRSHALTLHPPTALFRQGSPSTSYALTLHPLTALFRRAHPHPLTLSPSTLPQHCSDRAHPQPLTLSPSTLPQHCSEGLSTDRLQYNTCRDMYLLNRWLPRQWMLEPPSLISLFSGDRPQY